MIYIIGIDTDKTFIYTLRQAVKYNIDVTPINLRAVIANGDWSFSILDNSDSYISVSNDLFRLDRNGSYYCRFINLPSYQDKLKAIHWKNLIMGLSAWLECIPGIVINRPGSHAHNFSKPLHEYYLVKEGLKIPRSFTSSNIDKLKFFASKFKAIIKSCSSIRGNTKLLHPSDLDNFKKIQGPVHLQEYIHGKDVQVHMVGDSVFAELIKSEVLTIVIATKIKILFILYHIY